MRGCSQVSNLRQTSELIPKRPISLHYIIKKREKERKRERVLLGCGRLTEEGKEREIKREKHGR